jgi:hypothetical protein
LTFLQPLPAFTATVSSIVMVRPERVTTTRFCFPLAALYCGDPVAGSKSE